MAGTFRRVALPVALLLYVSCLYGATALLQDGLFERDGYYHARLAQMMPERGLSRSFPWTQLSTWKDRYCDKELLYHVAMMPFARIGTEPILGARIFATLLSVAVVATLFLVLRASGARWPAFFAALPLGLGGLFLARLGMIRSHVLSMLFVLLGIHFLLRRRWRALLVLGFVYAWSYTIPFVLLLTAAPFVLGRSIGRGGLDWRSLVASGAGPALGLAIHPYSPLTLETFFIYLQIFRMGIQGVGASGFELGNEIYPYPLPVFFDIYPLLLVLVPLLGLFAVLRRKQLSPETLGLVLSTLFWFAMTMASARFVEYLVLLLVVAIALAVRDVVSAPDGLPVPLARDRRWRRTIAIGTIGTLVAFHLYSMKFYVHYQTRASPPPFFEGASVWMSRNLAPGETVLNLYWDDFPDLFYAAPRQHYLWGLDPTYTIRHDAGRALWLERARRHQVLLDGPAMAKAFGSHYLVLRASRAWSYPELRRPPFEEVYRDGSAAIYRID